MIRLLLLATLCILLLVNCQADYVCRDPSINMAFVHFDRSEIDTIILKKYETGSNYQKLLDTHLIAETNIRDYVYGGSTDTTYIMSTYKGASIKADFDWQVFLPALNRTYFINEIVDEDRSGKCEVKWLDKSDCVCTNEVYSVKINGQTANFRDPADKSLAIYLYR